MSVFVPELIGLAAQRPPLIERDIVQMSWVVDDLAAAMQSWLTYMGIGPFYVLPHLQIPDQQYRGQTVDVDYSIALAQAGRLQIELIEQHNDAPTCYRQTVARGSGTVLHHTAVLVPDYDACLGRYEAAGFTAIHVGRNNDFRFCYVDTSAVNGLMVEIVEDVPSIRKMFSIVSDAAETWDGHTNPIRTFDD